MAVETRIMNCIMCPLGCEMTVTIEDGAVTSVTGNTCPRGPKYAHDEVSCPQADADKYRTGKRRTFTIIARRI